MKRTAMKFLALLLILTLALQLGGCTVRHPHSGATTWPTDPMVPEPHTLRAVNLMADVTPARVEIQPVLPDSAAAAADFSLRLFRAGYEPGKNTLLSPLSVLCALAMTANGAEGETLTQMETTLGLDRSRLNAFFLSYLTALQQDDGALRLANSIWFRDCEGFAVEPDFLQTNADVYGADAFLAPFDAQTLADINGWVSDHTDGMIPRILDQIPEDAMLYLVNALAFDAEWDTPYYDYQVSDGTFTLVDGGTRRVEFMYCQENLYLEDDMATGFIKPYAGGRYAFVALLPKEGITVDAYLERLDGAALLELLADPDYEEVDTAIPKFETDYETELSEVLQAMGMELPFDEYNAEFPGIGAYDGNGLYISRVIHKTYISVDEKGTRASAATAVEMAPTACAPEYEPKRVFLDRPFVYMLIDRETNLPFFIGTVMDPAQ